MGKLNVLFVIYDLDRGGPEMRLLDLVEQGPSDIRIFICVTSTNLSLLERFRRCNVVIDVVPVVKAYREFGKLREIVRGARANEIDIVNTYDLKGLVIALFIKAFAGRKVTLIHHVVDMLNNYSAKQKMALRLLLKGADGVVSNFRQGKELLGQGFYPEAKIELINNGVDLARFTRSRLPAPSLKSALGIPEEALVIGTVANLRKEKEYPFLLGAFKRLSLEYPDLRLLCVGGGTLLEETKRLAADLGVADRTVFTGYVESVPDYINIMDVFAICGSNEGFPNALIQAMSMEVPVVATAVGESREIIDDARDGFLYTPGDTEQFIAQIRALVDDAGFAAALAGRAKEKVDDSFSLAKMTAHYADYFRSVAPDRISG